MSAYSLLLKVFDGNLLHFFESIEHLLTVVNPVMGIGERNELGIMKARDNGCGSDSCLLVPIPGFH